MMKFITQCRRTLGWVHLLGLLLSLLALPSAQAQLPLAPLQLGAKASSLAAASAEPLDPEQAFKLSASAQVTQLTVVFDIAPGYYLYAEKISVRAAAPAVLGPIQLPKGEMHFDTTFNKNVETFRQRLRVNVPLSGASVGQTVQFTVKSQGCADMGICYPPQEQTLKLQLTPDAAVPQTGGLTPQPAGAALAAPPADIVAAPAARNGFAALGPLAVLSQDTDSQSWLAYLKIAFVFCGLGLLLAFTPCVLPMLPIVSSIVLNTHSSAGNASNASACLSHPSPSRWRGAALSAVYVLGMAVVFTAMGVAAGLAGQGLAATLQNPWMVGVFAGLMVALAGAQFGWYELQLPQAWLNRLNDVHGQTSPRGAWVGAALLGAVSALMVGPCLTAPLAAALAFIAHTGQAVKGGVALFSLALGMGLPLLLLAAGGGALLPRAGAWMDRVKHGFGFGLLATALWMLQAFLPAAVSTLGWAGLLLGAGVALGALEAAAYGWARVAKALGLVAVVWAAAVLWGAAAGHFDVAQPLKTMGSSRTVSPALVFEAVTSPEGLAQRLAQAKAQNKPVVLDFYADWCVSCVEMERFTFSEPAVAQALAGFVLLKADVTRNTPNDIALMKQFGIFGPPSTVFYNPWGVEQAQARVAGYLAAPALIAHLSVLQAHPRFQSR